MSHHQVVPVQLSRYITLRNGAAHPGWETAQCCYRLRGSSDQRYRWSCQKQESTSASQVAQWKKTKPPPNHVLLSAVERPALSQTYFLSAAPPTRQMSESRGVLSTALGRPSERSIFVTWRLVTVCLTSVFGVTFLPKHLRLATSTKVTFISTNMKYKFSRSASLDASVDVHKMWSPSAGLHFHAGDVLRYCHQETACYTT